MKSRLLSIEEGRRIFRLVLGKGTNPVEALKAFSLKNNLSASHFTGLGGLEKIRLEMGASRGRSKKELKIRGPCDIIALTGRVACDDGDIGIKSSVVINNSSGRVFGGQLLKGEACPILEIIIEESPPYHQKLIGF